MKTKETSTLYTTMSNNIGQVKKEQAQKEIERLNKQENTKSWRTDESDFMYVEDETDDEVHNPCALMKGYVWITCESDKLSTRKQALAWWSQWSLTNIVTDETEAYFNVNKRNYELVSNAKQFKQFNESLFKAYINKFSDEDKIQMLATLACETSTTNINLNDLLNRISCYKKNK